MLLNFKPITTNYCCVAVIEESLATAANDSSGGSGGGNGTKDGGKSMSAKLTAQYDNGSNNDIGIIKLIGMIVVNVVPFIITL